MLMTKYTVYCVYSVSHGVLMFYISYLYYRIYCRRKLWWTRDFSYNGGEHATNNVVILCVYWSRQYTYSRIRLYIHTMMLIIDVEIGLNCQGIVCGVQPLYIQ